MALIAAKSLDTRCSGSIIVGGFVDEVAMKAAAKVKVKGMIVGAISSALIPLANTMPYPILLTEGFGNRPMAEPTWTLLVSQNGREALLDARPSDRWTGHRPELIIPLPTLYTPPPQPADGQTIDVGRKVRVLRAPYTGTVGVVHSLPERPQTFLSGVHTMGAYVQVESSMILVPLANLEVFE
jgi:hypothetical protein